jgi:hypothetical protein
MAEDEFACRSVGFRQGARRGLGSARISITYESHQRLVAPLPLLGQSAGYEINPRWIAHANARCFDVKVNDIEGHILSLTLKTEYYVSSCFAPGASLVSFDLYVKRNGTVFSNTINYTYTGLQAYLVLKY